MSYKYLTELSSLPHNAIPFNQIKIADLVPAMESSIVEAKKKIIDWKSSNIIDYKHVIFDFEEIQNSISAVANIFYNLYSANATDALQEISEKFSGLITQFQHEMTTDVEIFGKIKNLWEKSKELNLTSEEKRILEKTYEEFTRNGALLNAGDKSKLKEIDQELALLSLKFSDQLLKATKNFQLHIENKNDLLGLPEYFIESAKNAASALDKSGWIITLDYPSYIPFLKFSKMRNLREIVYRASTEKATEGENNNFPIVKQLILLKVKRANLLGRKTHADFVLEQRMAKTPEKVLHFLNQFYERAMNAGKNEITELKNLAETLDGLKEIQKWDVAYYSERLKEKKYSYKEEELRSYFPLNQVMDGLFNIVEKLFQLKFIERKDLPVYAEDVVAYEVVSATCNEYQALLYLDLFPRSAKKQGAWMTNHLEQGKYGDKVMRPHVGIVCNFPKATEGKPSLLSWMDVTTLFHEFGHALHSMLSKCHYKTLSGTNVFWDFVELPSQIMENWVKQKESLLMFAKHYENGMPLSEELIEKVLRADKFQAGLGTLRQLSFSALDMRYHSMSETEINSLNDIRSFEREILKKYSMLPFTDKEAMSTGFSHIFAGGYSAGYYSYKWAEVLDADAFEYFLDKGIFNKDVAGKFRSEILEKGGTHDPMELYKNFRGREPKVDALLTRSGI